MCPCLRDHVETKDDSSVFVAMMPFPHNHPSAAKHSIQIQRDPEADVMSYRRKRIELYPRKQKSFYI